MATRYGVAVIPARRMKPRDEERLTVDSLTMISTVQRRFASMVTASIGILIAIRLELAIGIAGIRKQELRQAFLVFD